MNLPLPTVDCLKRPFPASEDPLRVWAIGTLYAMAFFSPFSIALGQISQTFMLFVVIVFLHRHWGALKESSLVWLTGAYIAYILVRGSVAALIEAPEMAGAHWEETFRWLRSGPVAILLFALALTATGNWLRHSLGALAALFLGFLVALAEGFDPGRLMEGLRGGVRYEEEINVFIDSLKLVAVILGLFAFAPHFLRPHRNAWLFGLRLALWLALLAGAGTFLLAIQTRSLWIAGLVGLLVLGLCAAWVTRGYWLRGHRRIVGVAGLAGVLVVAGLVTYSWGPISDRWNRGGAGDTLTTALTTFPTEWGESLPSDSVGIRAAYVSVALEFISQRPLFGYGPSDPRYLMEGFPGLPPKLEGRDGHFHDFHLEFLLSFGLVGYMILFTSVLVTLYEAQKLMKKPGRGRMLGLFVTAVMASLFIYGLTTTHLERFAMVHFYGLIIGGIWGSLLKRCL